MRIFTAALVTETNTFSPIPTGWPDFTANGICWNDSDYREETAFTECVLHVRQLGERDGHEVVLGPSAYANPAGPTLRAVYAELRDEILRQIAERGPFDAVILTLHGAMVAVGCEDCEGDLLQRARQLIGQDAFLGAMLDPHCHLSEAMVRAADIITIMKEYPHIDGKERLEELYDLCLRVKSGAVRPVSVLLDCKMSGVWPTRDEPIRSLVARIQEREGEPGMLSIAFAHGFPWGDVRDAGARLLAIGHDNLDAAESHARAVADELWALREHARIEAFDVDAALDEVTTGEGLLVLADVADNPGGGAPGDSTFLLSRALERGVTGLAAAILFDPQSLQACRKAGVGEYVDLDLGGKHGAVSGSPLGVRARVRGWSDSHWQSAAGPGGPVPLGPAAWIEMHGIHVVVSASRYQAVSPNVFTNLGIQLAGLRGVIVKSTHHFRARFASLAARMLSVNTPGALSLDFANIPYRARPDDFWPKRSERQAPTVLLRKLSAA
jgi:microcystin degradation protein MlrC